MSNLLLKRENLNIQLEAYAKAFENLTADNYASSLSPLLSPDISFQDPFNKVNGVESVLKVFAHMFANLENPKFEVFHVMVQPARIEPTNSPDVQELTGFLHWRFRFSLERFNAPIEFDGLSKVTFDTQGRINHHIDFWDPSEVVYDKVPVLNWLLKKVRRKLSASAL